MIFTPFPKMARLNREMWITEKIDGSNAQVAIVDSEGSMSFPRESVGGMREINGKLYYMMVGSRNKWITPESDNHGFARWAHENTNELWNLGPGRHFGEWWGSGINRGYGLTKGEKRFSLFNTIRWSPPGDPVFQSGQKWDDKTKVMTPIFTKEAPACCGVVPILWRGSAKFLNQMVEASCIDLSANGSKASPGYMNPEGIVVFHTAANSAFKVTLEDDESPKGLVHPA